MSTQKLVLPGNSTSTEEIEEEFLGLLNKQWPSSKVPVGSRDTNVHQNYPLDHSHHASRWSRLIDYPLTSMACSLSSTCDSDIFSISPIFCSSSGSIGRGSAAFAFTFFLPPKNCEVCVCVCESVYLCRASLYMCTRVCQRVDHQWFAKLWPKFGWATQCHISYIDVLHMPTYVHL